MDQVPSPLVYARFWWHCWETPIVSSSFYRETGNIPASLLPNPRPPSPNWWGGGDVYYPSDQRMLITLRSLPCLGNLPRLNRPP
jgi:hypothetical protein